MPRRIRLIGRYGNGLAALLLGLFVLVGVGKGDIGMVAIFLPFAALFVFNIYTIEKAARLLSEEEWLKAELRKAELRRKLADVSDDRGRRSVPASADDGNPT